MDELFKLQSETAPLSSKTVLEYHRLIHTVLATAEKELIVPYNAASKAMPPRAEAPERETLEPDEVKLILKALEEEPLKWQALIHLLIVTGWDSVGEEWIWIITRSILRKICSI